MEFKYALSIIVSLVLTASLGCDGADSQKAPVSLNKYEHSAGFDNRSYNPVAAITD